MDKEFKAKFGGVKKKVDNITGKLGTQDYKVLKDKLEYSMFGGRGEADARIRICLKLGMNKLAREIFDDNY